ncbi:division/cell wall cluster transcriptional repressor MraZ [Fodinibius halophilus]|uniref:Transcriptional regulator MraZ n=1 Tax=Fodinibius halophilus TaxID=1736908 RepID=A0A6M1TAC5_9BACT|nr:division/cell wall cluster transcriptional repressor MraZ [Fodinibius halophilus]NGP89413.1 division/cell wall cluster transcriptional repressor MraZ [Fodinibius halophilus]
MPSFKGEYEHSVDNKGRVSFPAKLRKALNPQAKEHFTIVRGLDKCLYLYPEDEWQQVEDQLSQINSFTKKGRTLKRNFLRFAVDVNLDNQNRIPLPSQLTEWAGIDGKAIFIGTGERVEIWSPEELKPVDDDLDFESYQELFEGVMGDDDSHEQQ